MGYRDDFYCTINIIGYSGDPENFPTVYFRTKEEFGRITQEHGGRFGREHEGGITQEPGFSQNVGRAEVQDATGYTIANEMLAEGERLVEKVNGEIIHTSRSKFTSVLEIQFETFALLAQAIWRYPNERYISDFSLEDIAKIKGCKAKMKSVHGELIKQKRFMRKVKLL
jgi:hypothetical protein